MMVQSTSYMKSTVLIPLQASPEQFDRLLALQRAFATVCNAIAPTVARTRVWNRVALHHMVYRSLREQFPALGSQMVCNAIYAVSRISRTVYQHPRSPFNVARAPAGPLPLVRFVDTCPVYFDRHTLSLKDGVLSLFTLDGRMRFQLALGAEQEDSFRTCKLLEIVLSRDPRKGRFELRFQLEKPGADNANDEAARDKIPDADKGEIPEYVLVEEVE